MQREHDIAGHLQFGAGMAIMAGVFVLVQGLLFLEHVASAVLQTAADALAADARSEARSS